MNNIPSRRVVIQTVRNKGFKIAAVMPYHYPRALLRAFKIHPIEVWGPPGYTTNGGDRHFQLYTCAIVRNAASFMLGEGGGAVEMALIPHNCDSLQGMGSVLRDFVRPPYPIFTFYTPRTRDENAVYYLSLEIRALARRLADWLGTEASDEDLIRAIEIEGEADGSFAAFCLNRPDYDVDDRTFYRVVRSREFLPAEDFVALCKSVPRTNSRKNGVGLLVSGIVPEPMDLFDRLNAMGLHVRADDLACCSRRIYSQLPVGSDPAQAVARSLMSAPPDPLTGAPLKDRFEHLLKRMGESESRGLLVYDVKFCEPELFDLPRLRDAMTQAGYPVLHIEHEMGSSLSNQTLTRLEAFAEMLK